MTYKDCIKIASLYLDENNLYNYTNDVDTYNDAETQQKIRYLCSCIDVVINEIASEYFPIKKIEKATATAKRIEYEALSEYVLDIRYVKRNGRKVNYEMYPSYIEVDEDGEYEVCYEYTPKSYNGNINEEIKAYGRITPRVVAIGAVAEYCLAFDRFDEAITYDKMFKDALVGVAKSKGKLKVKARRWE